jgi:hypothetical protein
MNISTKRYQYVGGHCFSVSSVSSLDQLHSGMLPVLVHGLCVRLSKGCGRILSS